MITKKTKIFIFETFLQKKIVDNIIAEGSYKEEDIIIINGLNHKIIIDDKTYDLNFNKIYKFRKSLFAVSRLKKLNLDCNELYSTHFTGLNAIFFSSFIKAEKRVLIDDGIGTQVILLNDEIFKRKLKFKAKYIFLKIVLFLFYRINLLSILKIKKTIYSYHSIYSKNPQVGLSNGGFKESRINFFKKIDKHYSIKTCFIGSPMLEFNLISKDELISTLNILTAKYGVLTYFLHPDEYMVNNLNIKNVIFKKTCAGVETFFENNGLPDILVSYGSSVLLNVTHMSDFTKCYYLPFDIYGEEYDSIYYSVLEQYGVDKFILNS